MGSGGRGARRSQTTSRQDGGGDAQPSGAVKRSMPRSSSTTGPDGRRQGQEDTPCRSPNEEIEKLDRAGEGEHRLQAGARRLGQGDQCPVQDRDHRAAPVATPWWQRPTRLDLVRARRPSRRRWRSSPCWSSSAWSSRACAPPSAPRRVPQPGAAASTPRSPTTRVAARPCPPPLPCAPANAHRGRAPAGARQPGRRSPSILRNWVDGSSRRPGGG